MKAGQLELRGIPQFDSGRWKLRLERVPVDPDNETTIGVDFDSYETQEDRAKNRALVTSSGCSTTRLWATELSWQVSLGAITIIFALTQQS